MYPVMLNRLISLWDSLAETAQGCDCASLEDRDIFKIRATSEGLPYLTHGLAGLGRLLLDGTRRGFLTEEDVQATRHKPQVGSTLPLFLYSAWSKVFTDDGLCIGASFEMRDGVRTLIGYTPPIEAVTAVTWIRQLAVVYSKLHLPHTPAQAASVLARFQANEAELAVEKGRLWATQYANETTFSHSGGGQQRLTDVLLNARRLVYRILCNLDPRDIEPKHGSGASACRTLPWERYDRVPFDPVINKIWPWLEFAAAGKSHCDQLLSAPFLTSGYPRSARGVFVPKDYRGPRFISCEPAPSMYYQQGLMTKLVTHLERSSITSGFVNFTNQAINQVLAREGSVHRQTATLDLKDASDRLSWDLVVLLWPEHWLKALDAVRSKYTVIDTPKGSVKVPLRKHAPMGSAVCFPVMALTIWALIKAANFSKGRANAWIYGDDIIVASRDASNVCDLLESVSLQVNRSKSFTGATPFRESCGKEYWNGIDTTPVYCRYDPSDDDTTAASLCSFATNYRLLRGEYAAYDVVNKVHAMTGCPIIGVSSSDMGTWDEGLQTFVPPPLVGSKHELAPRVWKSRVNPVPHVLLGSHCQCMRARMRRKWNADLQRFEYRIRRSTPEYQEVRPTTWGYVLRSSLIGGDLGSTEVAAVANRSRYKYGWAALDW